MRDLQVQLRQMMTIEMTDEVGGTELEVGIDLDHDSPGLESGNVRHCALGAKSNTARSGWNRRHYVTRSSLFIQG